MCPLNEMPANATPNGIYAGPAWASGLRPGELPQISQRRKNNNKKEETRQFNRRE